MSKYATFETMVNKPCKIKPFENLDGFIIGAYISKTGIEYQVRYYLNGEQKTDYFFEWEIERKHNEH